MLKMLKKMLALAAMAALIVHAQTRITTETRTTATKGVQTKTAVVPRPKPMPTRKVALVVQNRASEEKLLLLTLSDALTANLAGRGFQVINPYNAFGRDQNRNPSGEATPAASALGLARKLGADGMLTATVVDFQDVTLGTPPVLHQYSVRIAISLADAGTGGAVAAATVVKTSPKYTNNQIAQNRQAFIRSLLFDAAAACAREVAKQAEAVAWRPTPPPPPPPKPQPKPVPAPKPPAPAPLPPSTILDRQVDVLVKEMLANPNFVRNYDECKARLSERLPVAVLGGIANQSGDAGLNPLLEAAGERFRVRLFNTKLFEVKDDGVLVALARRIVASGNSPLENGELMGALKRHGSPDFFVAGDLKRLTDLDGVSYYKLRLAIHSLSTGRTVWEGIETFTRKSEVAK